MKTATKGEITRARLVRDAIELINQKGFDRTTINDIIQFTGVKKGNLYFHFSSKHTLGMAILDEIKSETAKFIAEGLKGATPLKKIDNYLNAVFLKHQKMKFIGGCLVGNTALEMGDSDPEFAAVITTIFSDWKRALAQIISQAQLAGELAVELNPEIMANHIIAVIEGGIMLSKVSKNGSNLKQALDSLRQVLGIDNKNSDAEITVAKQIAH